MYISMLMALFDKELYGKHLMVIEKCSISELLNVEFIY